MQYRRFGKLNWSVSALGFGCMRLPLLPGGTAADIDEDQAVAMIRHAIDSGVNYFDTAYAYHDGRSESLLGKALAGGYRERVRVATKSPVWLIEKPEDFDRLLDEQLDRLNAGPIDFYLLHGLSAVRWNQVQEQGLLGRAERAVQDGRIRHIGFSFHDDGAAFRRIVDGYDGWTLCQIQYNYTDVENQAGMAGMRYAAARGLAIVVMEPLLGGRIATPPPDIAALFEPVQPRRTPADWALQWVWDQPEVSVVLSGMSSMPQVEQNLRSAEESRVGSVSPAAHEMIARVRAAYQERAAIPCTACGYCLPCPNGVLIPSNFDLYNYGVMYGDVQSARMRYLRYRLPNPAERASACVGCRECEPKCPQGIPISEWMPRVHAVLGENQDYPA